MQRLWLKSIFILMGIFFPLFSVQAVPTDYNCFYTDTHEPVQLVGEHHLRIIQGREFSCRLECRGIHYWNHWLEDVNVEKNGQHNSCNAIANSNDQPNPCVFNIPWKHSANLIKVVATVPWDNCEKQTIRYEVAYPDGTMPPDLPSCSMTVSTTELEKWKPLKLYFFSSELNANLIRDNLYACNGSSFENCYRLHTNQILQDFANYPDGNTWITTFTPELEWVFRYQLGLGNNRMCYVEDDVTITPPNEEIVEGIENEEELENENGSETIDFNTWSSYIVPEGGLGPENPLCDWYKVGFISDVKIINQEVQPVPVTLRKAKKGTTFDKDELYMNQYESDIKLESYLVWTLAWIYMLISFVLLTRIVILWILLVLSPFLLAVFWTSFPLNFKFPWIRFYLRWILIWPLIAIWLGIMFYVFEKMALPTNSITNSQEMIENGVINLSVFLPWEGSGLADFKIFNSNHETGRLIAVIMFALAVLILPFILTSKLVFAFCGKISFGFRKSSSTK